MAAALLALVLVSLASAQTAYIYAQRDTPARAWLPVSIDGVPTAELRRGTFFAVSIQPGRHTVTIDSAVPLSFEATPNQSVHIRLDWNHHLNRPPIPVLSRVPSARAENEMIFLSYIPKRKIRAANVPSTDPRPPAKPAFQPRPPQ